MKNWNSIVVGIDFSDSSAAALREAARVARWNQCSLHIANVIETERNYEIEPESSVAISIARDQAEQKLKEFCLQHVEFFGDFNYHILVGHPFHELSQLAQDISANLLILGTAGQENIGRRVGTIASKCVRKSPSPVLLIHPSHDDPFRSILAAIDFSPNSLKAVEAAAEMAFENKSLLHLVHVYQPNIKLSDSPLCPPEGEETISSYRARTALQKQLTELQHHITTKYPDLPVKTHLLQGRKTSKVLAKFIESKQVGLTTLGTRGRTGLRTLLMGTTAERILNDCPCSIFAVKPDNFNYPA